MHRQRGRRRPRATARPAAGNEPETAAEWMTCDFRVSSAYQRLCQPELYRKTRCAPQPGGAGFRVRTMIKRHRYLMVGASMTSTLLELLQKSSVHGPRYTSYPTAQYIS